MAHEQLPDEVEVGRGTALFHQHLLGVAVYGFHALLFQLGKAHFLLLEGYLEL